MEDEMGEKKEYFVYMVKCEDTSIYTGITKDIGQRMYDHYYQTEKGAKYTRSRRVVSVEMVWEAVSYSSAARLEYAIKQLSRKQKLQLIEEPQKRCRDFFPKLEAELYLPRQEYVMDVPKLLKKVFLTVDKDTVI
jgi:putative endonuclease